jgi:hypothetical protein
MHGALTHLQCVADDGRVWPADAAAIGALDVPHWEPVVGQRLEVLPRGASSGGWVPATVAAADGSLVGEDGAPLAVTAARLPAPAAREGGCAAAGATAAPAARDLFRACASAERPLPVAPLLAGEALAARPNVVMFSDWSVNMERNDRGYRAFCAWREALPEKAAVAVIEVGAGTAVPSIRETAEQFALEFQGATLIRINLEAPRTPAGLGSRGIGLPLGALDALTRLDALLQEGSVKSAEGLRGV